MFTSLDQIFDGWILPKTRINLAYDLLVNVKYGNVTINKEFINRNVPVLHNAKMLRVAFKIDKRTKSCLVVFEPGENVDSRFYYNFRVNEGSESPTLSNKDLAIQLRDHFEIVNGRQNFQLKKYQEFQGVTFWEVIKLSKK